MEDQRSSILIYLASNPGEMDGERAVVEGLVLPELRARTAELGFDIELVDPEKAKGEEWDLARRFREIDACRPFFLAFLGERYGDPPRAVSLDVVAANPWLTEDPGRSFLELEILHAALRDSEKASASFFYFRDPGFPAMVPERHRGRFLAESERRPGTRLAGLKQHIRDSGRPVFDGYPCGWSDNLGRASRLDALAEQIIDDLWQAIQEQAGNSDATPASIPTESGPQSIPSETERPESFALRLPPERPLAVHENVQFTVYRPRVVEPLKWYPLLAFAHLAELPEDAPVDEPDPLEEVKEQAQRILGALAPAYSDLKQDSRYAVPNEAEITFLPEIPGFEVNPPRRTFLWLESVQREEFRIRAGTALDGTLVRGKMTVFWGSILLAEINLGIRVDSRLTGAATQPPAERIASRPFRNIFPSYSHRDSGIVEEFERYARTMGDRYLRDVHELRAGEAWNDRLKDLIEQADVFQLFWSHNAMRSPYVKEEWRYALSLGRSHFVRPTYWEDPLPEDPFEDLPPNELRRLHFQLLSTGAALQGTPHGPSVPAPEPVASPSRRFDPQATVLIPTVALPPAEDEKDATAAAPPPRTLEDTWTDEPTVVASAPPPPSLRAAPAYAPPPPPPVPVSAPTRGASVGAPPQRSGGRSGGFKTAAVLATAVLGLTVFALRNHFASQPPEPTSSPLPGNTTGGPKLGTSDPSTQGSLPGADFETYDPAVWNQLTAACKLSSDEIARLPSIAVPGTPMFEIFSSPGAFSARLAQRQLESLGAFLLPQQNEGSVACAVILDPSQPAVQEYVQSLRARGTEPRMVAFPRIPEGPADESGR